MNVKGGQASPLAVVLGSCNVAVLAGLALGGSTLRAKTITNNILTSMLSTM